MKKCNIVRLLTIVLVGVIATFAISTNVFATEYTNVNNVAAFETAISAGESVKLTSNIELTKPITIPKENITIDLNGKVLSYESSVAGEKMLTNTGELTITDSTDSAEGKILFKYVGQPDTSYSVGNYTILNCGTLIIENGTVENATEKMSHALYTIDNNSNGSKSSLTINGGKVVNTNYIAIRQFVGSNENTLTINNGIVTGTRAVMIQLDGSNATVKPNVSLNVSGGNLIGTGESEDYKLAVYSYSSGYSLENVKINISGGVLEGDLALSGGSNKTISELVNITGGKITNVYSYAEDEAVRIEISGGTFGTDVSDYVKEGLFVRKDGSNYIVEEPKAIPTIDTIDPEEEVKEVTVGVAKNEEVEDILLDSLAKDEEAAKAVEEAGASVNIVVEVDKIDEKTASEELKEAMAAIKEKAGKATIAHFFDVTVAVKNANTNDEIATIPTLAKEIELMILLPENLKNTDKDIDRKYFVVREHDGEVKTIDAKLSEDGKYLVFKSDKFSTYALAYEDVAKVVANPGTYDGISTYQILGAVSLIGIAAIALYINTKKIFN